MNIYFVMLESLLLIYPLILIGFVYHFHRSKRPFPIKDFNKYFLPLLLLWLLLKLFGISFFYDPFDWLTFGILMLGIFINVAYMLTSKKVILVVTIIPIVAYSILSVLIGTFGILGIMFIANDMELREMTLDGSYITKTTYSGNATTAYDYKMHRKVRKVLIFERTISEEKLIR